MDETKLPEVIVPPNAPPWPEPVSHTPAEPAAEPEPSAQPAEPESPRDAALEQLYIAFDKADVDGKVALFLRTVDERELMDDETAFDMLDKLFRQLGASDQRNRFDELVETLREKLPDVYAQEAHYCLGWRIRNLVAAERWDDVPPLLNEMATLAGKHIDELRRVLDMLDYHGQLPALIQAARIAWPEIKKSRDIVPWGIDEFAERAANYELFDYLNSHPDASSDDQELVDRLGVYLEVDKNWLAGYLADLLRPAPGPLSIEHFDLRKIKQRRGRDDDEGEAQRHKDEPDTRDRFYQLSIMFLGWLHRQKGVPLVKAEVGRQEMVQYLMDRAAGELDDRRSMIEKMMDRHKPAKQRIEHPLCPDRPRFDAYVARMLAMLAWRYHEAATLVQITPAWLEFLEVHGLLGAAQRQEAMRELRKLIAPVKGLLSEDRDDPHLARALDTWD